MKIEDMHQVVKCTVLGSGTSSGVPFIGCTCLVCTSTNPKNNRLRSSCLFQVDGKNIVVDTSPDLRQQALRTPFKIIDAVLYTHVHADHVHGIDELRIFNVHKKGAIPVYGTKETIDHLIAKFPYVFLPHQDSTYFIPHVETHVVTGLFDCEGVKVQMIPCHHGKNYITMNYRIGNIAWLTDTNGIPEESKKLLKGLKYLFLDGLRITPHNTHFNLQEAIKVAQEIGAEKTYLIHLTHDYDHDEFNKTLPAGIELAYDGLTVEA